MYVGHTIDGSRLTVQPDGRIDTNTAADFEEQVTELLPGMKEVDVDLEDVDYVSSAGLRSLLSLFKQCSAQNANMTVLNVMPEVMNVFEMTGFAKVLHFA
ncbi:MAG: STAS domain-containing protein [Clostridia bacterium]|nr:STAS domain-containing protein [Clostridia bacterium]